MNVQTRRFALIFLFVVGIIGAFAVMLASLGNTVSGISLQDKNPWAEAMFSGGQGNHPDAGPIPIHFEKNQSKNQSNPHQGSPGNASNSSFVYLPSSHGFSRDESGSHQGPSDSSSESGNSEFEDLTPPVSGNESGNSTGNESQESPQNPSNGENEDGSNEDSNEQENDSVVPNQDVPEFGTAAAALVLIGAGIAIHKKRA